MENANYIFTTREWLSTHCQLKTKEMKLSAPQVIAEGGTVSPAASAPTSFHPADGTPDPRWHADLLVGTNLPFPTRRSWHQTAGGFQVGFCEGQGAPDYSRKLPPLAGVLLSQRTGRKLPTHAWGNALDLNPQNNAQAWAGDMDLEMVPIFDDARFTWGATGKARPATSCIFSSAQAVEVSDNRQISA
jgi:hypothetical protein